MNAFFVIILVIFIITGITQYTFAQTDIAKIVSPKYELKVGDDIYEVYYGYHGSLEFDVERLQTEILPEVVSMSINEERKSLTVTLENVQEQQFFWVMIPFDVMSAEGDDFILLIDGIETGYEFTKSVDDNTIGMIVPEGTHNIEIVGTSVIPEFESIAMMILAVSLIPLVFYKKFVRFKK